MLSSTFRSIGSRLGPRLGQAALQACSARFLSSLPKGHIVVALGGNALLRRGQDMTAENQRQNIANGVSSLANIINENTVTIVHGNGPQVGLLLLESAAYEKQTGLRPMSLDILDAETEGMIGYLLEQELSNHIGKDRGLVTVLSQIVCDPNDPAFANPTKFVGPIYTKEESEKLGLQVKPDGDFYRRVVPSPLPVKLVDHQMQAVRQLTDQNCIVICAGGGGIPVVEDGAAVRGIEAVIDKDRAAAMMGAALQAQGLLILTDVPAVAVDFGKPTERRIRSAPVSALESLMHHFPAGSMGPKVESAMDFVKRTGGWAAIGSLNEADQIMKASAGTVIRGDEASGDETIEFYDTGNGVRDDHAA